MNIRNLNVLRYIKVFFAHDGKRAQFFSGIYVKEGDFDNNKKKLKGNSPLAEKKNQQLENLKFRVFNTYHEATGLTQPCKNMLTYSWFSAIPDWVMKT